MTWRSDKESKGFNRKTIHKIVASDGALNSKIAFVGEAPGEEETRQGIPFVGSAGKLFSKIMATAGLRRSACYITNVIKERPNKNNIKQFVDLSKKHPVETSEYKEYIKLLKEELERTEANIIVALGTVPMYALTGHHTKVTKRRGSIYESTLLPGRKVLVTIHPSAALRQYEFTPQIRLDLTRAKEESKFPEIIKLNRDIKVDPSYSDVILYLQSIKPGDTIGIDIEVKKLEVSHFGIAKSPIDAMSIDFYRGGKNKFSLSQEQEIWELIANILRDERIKKIIQNAAFEKHFLFRKYGITIENFEDTMVAQAVIAPDLPKGLDFLCSVYTREPYYKDEGKQYFKDGEFDDHVFSMYNGKDSAVLPEIFPHQLKELEKLGNMQTYRRHLDTIDQFLYMQERGIRMDTVGMNQRSLKCSKVIEKKTLELHEICGREINPKSPKQLKDYFYVDKKITPYKSRSTGLQTVNEDALKRIARKGYKEANLILAIRKESKLDSTYLSTKLEEDHRLRCSYNTVGTKQGRASSSKSIFGYGTNMQNQPKEMKKFMLADKGYLIGEIDKSQAENRIVAYIAPEPLMIEAFETGKDVHRLTAGLIFGKHSDEISDEPGSCSLGNGEQSERFWGKKANHGLNYDLGYKSFALYYEIPEREAKFIVERYHHAYPGIRRYHRWIQSELHNHGRLTNLLGRTRKFYGKRGDQRNKEAYSFIPQSTVPDELNSKGLVNIYHSPSYKPIELLNQVHDSIVFQIPVSIGFDNMAKMLKKLKWELETPLSWKGNEFSIPIDCKMGKVLGMANGVDLSESVDIVAERLEGIYNEH